MGNRSGQTDDFADVIHSYSGVFGDSAGAMDTGLSKHDAVDIGVTPTGAVLEFRCPGCGRMRQLHLDYPELVALKFQLSPHLAFDQARQFSQSPSAWRWIPDEHQWGLVMRCSFCPYHYPVRLAPHEPESILGKARRSGYINAQGERAVMDHCNALRQRLGR